MKTKAILVLVITALLFNPAQTCIAKTASFRGLGFSAEVGNRSLAYGVSADGSVVVGWVIPVHAFRWTKAGATQYLGDFPGEETYSLANSASANGSIVIGYNVSTLGIEAFRWTESGGIQGLGDLPDGIFRSYAYGISDNGLVIVGSGQNVSGEEAFRWTESTGMQGLGYLPGGSLISSARAVSSDGSVIVGYSRSALGGEAFRWTESTGMQGLGDLPGGYFDSGAYAVSANGNVIVGEGRGILGYEAVRWTETDGMVGLGYLPNLPSNGVIASDARDVSADGSIVVGYSQVTYGPGAYCEGCSGPEAFIWDEHNGMRGLKEVLENEYGLNLTGWRLQEARGISNDGLTIVGYGFGPDGGEEAWVATFPSPNTPPIADAGSDQTVMDTDGNGNEQVTLDGSGSSDSDGNIISWVWTDDLGNIIPDGEITTATLSIGIHTITLTVTDDDGLTNTDTVTVTVEPYPNQPPVANADGPYTIYVGDTLTLDASGSTDEHNNIVSYLWDLDDNNSFETDAGSQAEFDVNYTYLQSLGLLVGNTYNIHLKITDSVGQSDVNDSTLTIIPTPALQVFVDIKPGNCPNPVNVKSSGVLPAAILGTADFDITTIDPTSIRLAGIEPLRNGLEDVSGPAPDSNDCNCSEDGPDGFLDLTLKFKTQKIVEAIGDVNEGDVLTLELTGVLIGERPIEGADCILIRGGHKPFNKADINKDGKVDCSDFAIFAQNWLQSSIVED